MSEFEMALRFHVKSKSEFQAAVTSVPQELRTTILNKTDTWKATELNHALHY